LPWLVLSLLVLFLYLTNHWPFKKGRDGSIEIIQTTTVLQEIESLGRMELVRYNFKEILDYNHLSSGKIGGSVLLNSYDLEPDITAVMVASGEAVGCIDFAKIQDDDIIDYGDSVQITLPSPELCYHKLDLQNTKIHSFQRKSWWSRIFPDDEDEKKVFELAYKAAEEQIKISALQSGILEQTKDNAVTLLGPMLKKITNKEVVLRFAIPEQSIEIE
jgi:hypothetical protein